MLKARIKIDFLLLFLYHNEIDEFDCVEVDPECLNQFDVGDEVEILREIEVGKYADNQKSYVIYNPKNHQSITVAESFLQFE